LKSCAWPGNIRELGGKIRKAYSLSDEIIDRSLFSEQFSDSDMATVLNEIERPEDFPTYKEFVDTVRNHLERVYLEKAMILANGKRADAARLTNLPYTTYIHKRKTLGLTANQTM
jgi:DNA-binding NtrC family response regulator